MAKKFEMPAFDSERVKAAFAKVSDRSKTARDQLAARRETLVQFNKDNLEALQESGKIVVAGAKPLASDVVANTKRQLRTVGETVKSGRGIKSPVERLKLQGEAAKTQFAAAQAETKAFGQSVAKLVGDAAAPLKGRFAAVKQQVAA